MKVVLLAALIVSCAHIPPPLRDFGACVVGDVEDNIAEVATDLVSTDFTSLLATLGKRISYDVVDCAVHELLGRAKVQARSAPTDVLAPIVAQHAEAWLGRK